MTIKIDEHTDAFTHAVYEKIDRDVRATFTPRQVAAIENAIRASKPFQKHPVDIRGVIPCIFARFYFVFLVGRDRRSPTRNKEQNRMLRAGTSAAMFSVYLLLCAVAPILLLLLYGLKTLLGIDVFADQHLYEFLGDHGKQQAHRLSDINLNVTQ